MMKEKIKMKLKEKMGGKAPMAKGKKPMGKKEKVKSKMPY